MIADEVMSGFGRTGKWFAVDNWGVVPDIMTMAKGLTSAYAPLGAVAMKPEIASGLRRAHLRVGADLYFPPGLAGGGSGEYQCHAGG